jgi:hypothetical protein
VSIYLFVFFLLSPHFSYFRDPDLFFWARI